MYSLALRLHVLNVILLFNRHPLYYIIRIYMYIIEGSTILRIIKRIFILDLVEVSKKKKINGRKCTFFIIYANTSRENFGKLSKQNFRFSMLFLLLR